MMDPAAVQDLKVKLKQEINILNEEKDRIRLKAKESDKMEFLLELVSFYEKLIVERKLKIVAVNKLQHQFKPGSMPTQKAPAKSQNKEELEHLKTKVVEFIKKSGGSVLCSDFNKDAEAKDILRRMKQLEIEDIETFARGIPSILVESYNGTVSLHVESAKIVAVPIVEQQFAEQSSPEFDVNQVQSIVAKILYEQPPKKYLCGKDVIKMYKKYTHKPLCIGNFENIKDFMDNIKGIDCSSRGYRLLKEMREKLNEENAARDGEAARNRPEDEPSKKGSSDDQIEEARNEARKDARKLPADNIAVSAENKKTAHNKAFEIISRKCMPHENGAKASGSAETKKRAFGRRTRRDAAEEHKNAERRNRQLEEQSDSQSTLDDDVSREEFKKFEDITLKQALEGHATAEVLEAFVWMTRTSRAGKWVVEMYDNETIDASMIILSLELIKESLDDKSKTDALVELSEQMLTSMYKFEYPITRRQQRNVTEIYKKIEKFISPELKLAIAVMFKLANLITPNERRVLMDRVSTDSRLNWLLVDEDGNELLKKTQTVNEILESSVLISIPKDSDLNNAAGVLKKLDFKRFSFLNDEKRVLVYVFHRKSIAQSAMQRLLESNMSSDNFCLSKDKICTFFNSSVCIKSKNCSLEHVCAFCFGDEHGLFHCLHYNK